jgi:indole-3-glycerol phosphate synthase
MTTGRLEHLVAAARQRADTLRSAAPDLERRAAAAAVPLPFGDPRADGTVGIITEVKRRSPSAGAIHETLDPVAHAVAYAAGGAVGISVLTEPAHFGGSLDDLRRVAAAVRLPVLRKDFILEELQLVEARAAGAAAALLIVRILPELKVRALIQAARDLGLVALVEVHSPRELETALAADATVVGINSRDLDNFTIDHAAAERLLATVPADVVAVAESGIETRHDVERVAAAGADHVLVGTAVARLAHPESAVRALTGVHRSGRPSGP